MQLYATIICLCSKLLSPSVRLQAPNHHLFSKNSILLCLILGSLFPLSIKAQQGGNLLQISPPVAAPSNYTSIRHEQNEFYRQLHLQTEAQYDSLWRVMYGSSHAAANPHSAESRQLCNLTKQVYGWQPYWIGSSVYNNYDYARLGTLCYFSYELVPSTGNYSSIHSWKTTSAITLAQAAGCNVDLCVTNFGSSNNTTFLNNTAAWDVLIDSLKVLLDYRNANGVNIDFEGMGSSHRTPFKNFMVHLCDRLHTERPGTKVSTVLYAVDWSSSYDIPNLNPVVDEFIIMAYDYHYSGGSAGPVGPLHHGTAWSGFPYTQNRSVNFYLNQGMTSNKLLLGVPYYGIEWPTADSNVPTSSTTGSGTARLYSYVKNNYTGVYTYQWDQNSLTPYYAFQSGGQWKQCWWDDENSLSERYDMVLDKGIGGIGIWALGYDDNYSQLWQLIYDKFTDCGSTRCNDNAYDTSGPLGNYLNNEAYNMTYSNPNGGTVQLSFNSFNLENNYDFLYVYDGPSIASPLIGTYTGTTLPPTINSTASAITIRFTSDGATVAPGFEVNWQCINATCAPTTVVTPLATWNTSDFTANFTDQALCGNSVAEQYYLVGEYQTDQWRANTNKGFFYDDFETTSLHSAWTNAVGTWGITGGSAHQSDQTATNTNLYAALTSDNTATYLFHWRAMMSGTGTNRRSGIHFFCSDGAATQRGNSYMVYFRADNDKAQIYEATANTISAPLTDDPVTIDPNVWYDYKVTYSPASGQIKVYVNNILVSQWTDTTPLQTGSFISLRTGECDTKYDFVRVYKSRSSNSALVGVGSAATKDARYESMNALSDACTVISIIKDNTNQWSVSNAQNTKIDYTNPSSVTVNDGTAADIDQTEIQGSLSGNWTAATDPNSDIATYWYAIGTSAGASDVVAWTNNGNLTTFTQTGLSLVTGTTYYISVKSQNGAGLQSSVASSDGLIYCVATATVNAIATWQTADFTANYTDTPCSSPFDRMFYQVQDYNGTSWRANGQRGFLFDDFSAAAIHSDWTQQSGTWAVNSSAAYIADETNSNTNLYAAVNQSATETYLYEWSAKISGTGANRRSGLHFFADSPTATNRGNSYLIWWRADQDVLEFYKVSANTLTVVKTVSLTVDVDVWYQYKVVYSPANGTIYVWRNGQYIDSWTDSTPFTSGSYVSLRNGNCQAWFDDLRVWKQRNGTSTPISIGNTSTDVRYQNPNPATSACRIVTTAKTTLNTWTTAHQTNVNIDWTNPTSPTAVNDGTGSDIDITNTATSLSANWTAATDPNSDIATYWYAIGTSAGASDIVAWTNNGNTTTFTQTGLALNDGTTYYVSIKSQNGAGLQSSVASSDGIMYQVPCATPTNLSVTATTINSVSLQWTAALNALSYQLRYKLISDATWTVVNTGSTATSFTISGLSACSNYEVQIQTICSTVTQSAYSSSVNFTTPNYNPNWTAPAPIRTCDAALNLNTLLTGTTGGTWSGTGVSGSTFNPASVSVGTYSITYTVGSGTCQAAQSNNIVVTASPTAAWTGTSLAQCSGTLNLNTLLTGTTGGTWSGSGVSGSTFNPASVSVGT